MKYWEPSLNCLAIEATWLTVGAKFVGPYNWTRLIQPLYDDKTPVTKIDINFFKKKVFSMYIQNCVFVVYIV